MGAKTKEQGGGAATGLANNLIGMLNGGIGGSFGGASAGAGASGGMAQVLNDFLAGGAGHVGGAMADMIHQTSQRNVNDLRARYGASGGMSMGTPAAYAEAMMRSQEAPQLTQAIGGLQLQALMPMMQMMTQLAGKGISQRESVTSPSGWGQAAGLALPIAGAILGGPMGGMIGSQIGGMFGGGTTLPSGGPTPFAGFDLPMMNF